MFVSTGKTKPGSTSSHMVLKLKNSKDCFFKLLTNKQQWAGSGLLSSKGDRTMEQCSQVHKEHSGSIALSPAKLPEE